MATATKIAGNPRLIKRFLNTVSIRMSIAKLQGVTVDEEVLAKLLLFERCADESAYRELVKAVNEDDEGKARFIKKLEEAVAAGEECDDPPTGWKSDFVRDWLALDPSFTDLDLRPAMYVSREHLPLITPADQMSPEAVALLAAVLDARQVLDPVVAQIGALSKAQGQQTPNTVPLFATFLIDIFRSSECLDAGGIWQRRRVKGKPQCFNLLRSQMFGFGDQ